LVSVFTPNLQTELLLTENSTALTIQNTMVFYTSNHFVLLVSINALKNHFLTKPTHELRYIKTLQIIYYRKSTNQWFPKCSSHTC